MVFSFAKTTITRFRISTILLKDGVLIKEEYLHDKRTLEKDIKYRITLSPDNLDSLLNINGVIMIETTDPTPYMVGFDIDFDHAIYQASLVQS